MTQQQAKKQTHKHFFPTMRWTAILLVMLGAVPGTVVARMSAAAQTVLLADKSEVSFVFRQMGTPVSGRFQRFDAQLDLNLAQPEAGSVVFTVDTASVTLGMVEMNTELVKPEWLASSRFPQATFTSRSIRAVDAERLEVTGTLTLKGVTRELTVPVALTRLATAQDLTTASGSVVLKRMDFQVGEGLWSDRSLVADEVQVSFRLLVQGLAR